MSRTRLIRPTFFKHAELYDAERETGLPLRVAFAGLWTVADKPDGRFAWKPRDIKVDVCPHDELDFAVVLDALHRHGFVGRYVVDGKHYGHIPSFPKHQTFHKSEAASKHPAPDDPRATPVMPPVDPREGREDSVAVTVAVTGTVTGANCSAPAAPELMDLVRQYFYAPDGTCPTDWSEVRERSVLSALMAKYSTGDIADAIEGAAILRDYPGQYGERIDWLEKGVKLTLRALYNTRSGVRPLFGQAVEACHRKHNLSAERESSAARQLTRVSVPVPNLKRA